MNVIDPVDEETLEGSWNAFLASLEPWELHKLLPDELANHDAYASGETTLKKILEQLQPISRIIEYSND